tara:strand:- start:231 stop:824 length:594 start_codon:yes stop_codon:yes gene_type:complete
MFVLDGRTLALDVAFQHRGIQYPNNWLRLASAEERAAIGITEQADPPRWDEKFYWGYDSDNNLIPKQLDDVTDDDGNVTTGLKTLWKAEQNEIAASLLNDSDKRVIKALDEATTFAEFKAAKPANYTTYRAAVRTACNTRQAEIDACSDVATLKELLYGQAQIPQTDDDGQSVLDADGNIVWIANPNIATAWPDEPS